MEEHLVAADHVASGGAAGQNDEPEPRGVQQLPAGVDGREAAAAEHVGDYLDLVVVELEHVGLRQGLAYDLLGIVALPEVDVKDLQRALGHRAQEGADAGARRRAPLRQRAEAHAGALRGDARECVVVFQVVPGDSFDYVVLRHSGPVEADLHGAGGSVGQLQGIRKPLFIQRAHGLLPESVAAHRAERDAVQTESGHMKSKVGGRSAQFLPARQHVPQDFAETDDVMRFHIIHYMFFSEKSTCREGTRLRPTSPPRRRAGFRACRRTGPSPEGRSLLLSGRLSSGRRLHSDVPAP